MWGHQFIFISAFILCTTAAAAGPACANLFSKERAQEKVETKKPEPVFQEAANDNSVRDHFYAVAKEIDSVLGPFKKPSVKIETVNRPVTISYFNPIKGLISMGRRLEGRDPAMRDLIFTHEYSHAIFAENFKVVWKGQQITYKQLIDMARQEVIAFSKDPALNAMDANIHEIAETLKLARHAKNERVAQELEKYLAEAIQERAPYQQAIDLLDKLHEITIAYNELFADTLPVLLRQNPHAMHEAIYKGEQEGLAALRDLLVNRTNNPDAPAPRDFVMTPIENWKHELNDTYTLLDPSRGVLWELYMKDLPREKIPAFLKTFFETVSAHLALRQGRGENLQVLRSDADLAQLNREFLRLFAARAEVNNLLH